MAGTAEDFAAGIPVFGGGVGGVCAGRTWLGDFLVDDSIKLLLDKQVVMPVKDSCNVVLNEQLVDGHTPAGTLCIKTIGSVRVVSPPLVKFCHFDTAATVLVKASN